MVMQVVKRFFVTSMFMWMLPVAILYGFQHDLFPGLLALAHNETIQCLTALIAARAVIILLWTCTSCLNNLTPYSQTLVGGFLAVISVNVVIAFYIFMAMKEPSHKHEPDPTFVANAKASVSQTVPKSDGKEE